MIIGADLEPRVLCGSTSGIPAKVDAGTDAGGALACDALVGAAWTGAASVWVGGVTGADTGVDTGIADPVAVWAADEGAGGFSAGCDWLLQPTNNAPDKMSANVKRARYERLKQSSQNGQFLICRRTAL